MILPDVNLLVHAHNLDSPSHEKAKVWWDQCLSGNEGVGLAWVAMLGFIRITTHPRILELPMHVRDATGRLADWLSLSHNRRTDILHGFETCWMTSVRQVILRRMLIWQPWRSNVGMGCIRQTTTLDGLMVSSGSIR